MSGRTWLAGGWLVVSLVACSAGETGEPTASTSDEARTASCKKNGDRDGDAVASVACGGLDCDDADASVHPGATDVCGDGIDQDCAGGDATCAPPPPGTGGGHAGLTWSGPGTCVGCHRAEAEAVFGSQHYQWKGQSPTNVNGVSPQGKLNGVNSYCIAVEQGNWGQCNGCHVGRGAKPGSAVTQAELENIDCLLCHQEQYRRRKDASGLYVPDTAAMAISMDEAVQTVQRTPTRAACLQCHAKAGGGDAYKRGDLALAHAATADRAFDVHMSTGGADLTCAACHRTSSHRIAGAGTDLRATDSSVRIACTDCHAEKATATGHTAVTAVNQHVGRVACQTCHIPRYARNAADTAASEATETHREWRAPALVAGIFHPGVTLANDLLPRYAFWNGKQDTMLLGDLAVVDAVTGNHATSRPEGGITDPPGTKLFPFKYKTAAQPLTAGTLTPMDMATYRTTGDFAAAARQGALNMGLDPAAPVSWVTTDTMQLLNHEVAPPAQALGSACTACHGASATQLNLRELGYVLKAAKATVCAQCHQDRSYAGWQTVHDKHVKERGYDCAWCHGFSRPERGLR